MSRLQFTAAFLVGVMALGQSGCVDAFQSDNQIWHTKMGWKATEYFDDPQVIALCQAIEANDLKEIDRVVSAGADVNAKGKGNMTPLLWAFPDNQLKRFERLLEHGADPNVVTESDFGVARAFHAGDSVTHMAARTAFPGYFAAVMEHGGDPNIIDRRGERTLLHNVITAGLPDAKDRVELLIGKGADVDIVDSIGDPPVREAVTWFGQFDIALILLKAGANTDTYKPGTNSKLVHAVQAAGRKLDLMAPEQQNRYKILEQWLEDRGEDFAPARLDNERWMEWGKVLSPKAGRRMMEREVAERKAREKAEAEKKAAIKGETGEEDATAVPANEVEPE